jgi:GWxTD domain-containing protein
MKRMNAEPVSILLNNIDISQLPSGNYILVFETRDRNNDLLGTKEIYFQRQNPNAEFNIRNLLVLDPMDSFVASYHLKDSLALYIDYLYPISTDPEKSFAKSLIAEGDVETMQRYFLNFWNDRNPSDPEGAWQTYKLRVIQANHNFTSVRIKGYKTDRGRVYLQYGEPNVIAESHNEPAAYPYEIWHYYEMQGQRDIKFVFYTRDMATNDFQLIHSNAIGELTNQHWQAYIYGRTWDPQGVDDVIYPGSYGSFATDYYIQPR